MSNEATPSDEDALRWDGDDDPNEPLAAGWTPVGPGAETVATEHPPGDAAAPFVQTPMGTKALLATGLLAGVYVLFTIGWFVATRRIETVQPAHLVDLMFQASKWLGMLAPALWFATVFLTTRRGPRWQLFTFLGIGVLLLIPWPFVMLGVVGQ